MGLDKITVSWKAPATGILGIQGYSIYKSDTSIGRFRKIATVDSNILLYIDEDVVLGEDYFYKIAAFNDAGDGPLTDAVFSFSSTYPSAITDLYGGAGAFSVPSQPLNLVGDGLYTGGSAVLTWEVPADDGGRAITNYRVYRNDIFLIELNPVTFTYTDGGHNIGDSFSYSVSAVNNIGEGEKCSPVVVEILLPNVEEIFFDEYEMPTFPFVEMIFLDTYTNNPAEAPSEPLDLITEQVEFNVRLHWTVPLLGEPITHYKIYRSEIPSDPSPTFIALVVNNDLNVYTDLTPPGPLPKTYYYKVSAVNSFPPAPNEGPKSDESSIIIEPRIPWTYDYIPSVLIEDYEKIIGSNTFLFYRESSNGEIIRSLNDGFIQTDTTAIDETNYDKYAMYLSLGQSPYLKYTVGFRIKVTGMPFIDGRGVLFAFYGGYVSIDIKVYDDTIIININGDERTFSHDFTSDTNIIFTVDNSVGISHDITFYLNNNAGLLTQYTDLGELEVNYAYIDLTTYHAINNQVTWGEIGLYPYNLHLPDSMKELSTYTGDTVPEAINDLLATAYDYDPPTTPQKKVTLTWTEPLSDNPITGYKIYRVSSNDKFIPDGENLIETIGNVLLYDDLDIVSEQSYMYIVCAISNLGDGVESNYGDITTPLFLPTVPLNLLLEQIENNINLTWQPPIDGSLITNYRIYRGTTSPPPDPFFYETGNVNEYYDNDSIIPGDWYYQISAVNATGEGPKCEIVHIVVTIEIPWTYQYLPIQLIEDYQGTIGHDESFSRSREGIIVRSLIDGLNINNASISSNDIYEMYDTFTALTGYIVAMRLKVSGNSGDEYFYFNAYGDFNQEIYIFDDRIDVDIDGTEKTYNHDFTIDTDLHIEFMSSEIKFYIDGVLIPELSYLLCGDAYYIYIQCNRYNGSENSLNLKEFVYYKHGHHPPSDMMALETYSGPTVPESVTDFESSYSIDNEEVTLTWAAPIDPVGHPVTGYNIYRDDDSDFLPIDELIIATINDVLTYVDTGIVMGQVYYYIVRPINDLGIGVESLTIRGGMSLWTYKYVPSALPDDEDVSDFNFNRND